MYETPTVVNTAPKAASKSLNGPNASVVFSNDETIMWVHRTRYNQIPKVGYLDYYISKGGVVRNLNGRLIKTKVTSSDSKVRIGIGSYFRAFYRFELVHLAWPELAPVMTDSGMIYNGEEYWYIPESHDYMTTREGKVIRLKNFTYNKIDPDGRVHLSIDGKQRGLGLKKLLKSMFGDDE